MTTGPGPPDPDETVLPDLSDDDAADRREPPGGDDDRIARERPPHW